MVFGLVECKKLAAVGTCWMKFNQSATPYHYPTFLFPLTYLLGISTANV